MKTIGLTNLIIFLGLIVFSISSQAGLALIEFQPLTATHRSVPQNSSIIVNYLVTNQSLKSHTLLLQNKNAIQQIQNIGMCKSPFTLASKESCVLSLQIHGNQLTVPLSDGPIVCQSGSSLQCYRPKSNDVLTIKVTNNQYLVGGTITGLTGHIVLLNNGSDSLTLNSNGSFTFPTPMNQDTPYSVVIHQPPTGQTCSVSNGSGIIGNTDVHNIGVYCASTPTQLSIPNTATIPASLSATTSSITVTNIGPNFAYNVSVTLPSDWQAVNQNSTDCVVLPPNHGCSIIFSSSQAYIAQGNIIVTGTNVINPPTMAIAFTVQDYLVWDVSFGTIHVIDQVDAPTLNEWGGYLTSVGMGARSVTEGKDNTQNIVLALGAGVYAAQNCYESTSGGAAMYTWFLPALCQMGEGSNCTPGFANINTNLAQLGFGGFGTDYYWTSTEAAAADSPELKAWRQKFDNNSTQDYGEKYNTYAVRCAREIPLT